MGKDKIPELRIEKIEIVQLANHKDVKVWFVSHPHPVADWKKQTSRVMSFLPIRGTLTSTLALSMQFVPLTLLVQD